MAKKLLFVVHQSPIGSIWVNEAFRTAMGMYGEDLEPMVLLVDEGVVAYSAALKPDIVGLLPCTLAQKMLQRYETKLLAVKEDLERYRVGPLDGGYNVEVIPRSSLTDLFHDQNLVIFM